MKEWRELFLDREKELKYLHTAWGLAQQGKPQIAVLIGETGLGKTRLVQQFYRDIANKQESENIPYWPTSLQVGRNLILQPEIANSNATIPWLWWSMRFKEPDDRNVVSTTSPFEIDDKNLAANAAPILRQRNVKSSTGKVAESLVTLLADWTGLGLAGQIWEVIGMIKEYKNLEVSAKATNNELQLDLVKKLTEKTLNALRLFLDKKISDAPTVPVILVIDDAQWIDAVTLQALYIIHNEAVNNNWPLMILATHWEREWNEVQATGKLDWFIKFKEFYEYAKVAHRIAHNLNDTQYDAFTAIKLGKLENLENIAIAALPGETPAIHDRLTQEADGNPRAMEEMLLLLLNKPSRYFVDADTNRGLNKKGLQKVAKLEKTVLYEKIKQRFDELDDDIQEILTTSSLFGVNFQRPLILALIEFSEDIVAAHYDNAPSLLNDAEHIHALLHAISANGHAFQQKIYRDVAFDYLKDEMEDTYEGLCYALSKVVDTWLIKDKLALLSQGEQIQLCEFAISHLINPDGSAEMIDLDTRVFAFEYLAEFLEHNQEEQKIAQWWTELINKTDNIPLDFFCKLTDASIKHLNLTITYNSALTDKTISHAERVLAKIKNLDQFNSTHYASWARWLGVIFYEHTARSEEAHFFLEESLQINRKLAIDNCEVGDSQGEVLDSLKIAGDMSFKHCSHPLESARFYEEILQISRDQITRFGETPNLMNAVAFGLRRLSRNANELESNIPKAKSYLEEALKISRDAINRFGEAPKILLDLSATLNSLAQFSDEREDDVSQAKAYHEESLRIGRKIISCSGETLGRLENLKYILLRLGGYENNTRQAKAYYEESLCIEREIISRFGETPDRLVSLADTLDFLGTNEIENNILQAKAYYDECLQIERGIISRFGETPDRKKRLKNLLFRIFRVTDPLTANIYSDEIRQMNCDLITHVDKTPEQFESWFRDLDRLGHATYARDGYVQQAKGFFEESLCILRDVIDRFGDNSGRRSVLLSNKLHLLGNKTLNHENDVPKAKGYYEESVRIIRKLNTCNGELPLIWLRDLPRKLFDLGKIAIDREGDISQAKIYFEDALCVSRDIVARYDKKDGIAQIGHILPMCLEILGDIAIDQDNNPVLAKDYYKESSQILRDKIAAEQNEYAQPEFFVSSMRSDYYKKRHLDSIKIMEDSISRISMRLINLGTD